MKRSLDPLTGPWLLALGLSLLIGCDAGGGVIGGLSKAAPALTTAPLTGVAFKGPIDKATVEAYALQPDGSLGALLGSARTASDGSFAITLTTAEPGPLILRLSGGSYSDEATGLSVSLGTATSDRLEAAVLEVGPSVALTPLSTMAASLARERIRGGEGMSSAVRAAEAAVSNYFGLPSVQRTFPASPRGFLQEDQSPSEYTALLTALTQYARTLSAGGAPVSALELTQALALDLSDGRQDGQARGTSVTIGSAGITLAPDAVRAGLAAALDAFFAAGNLQNRSGLLAVQLAPIRALLKSAGDTPVFPGAAPTPRLHIMDITSGDETLTDEATIKVIVGDDADAKAWLVSEGQATQPSPSDPRFGPEPRRHTLTPTPGTKTVFAWVRNAAGVVNPVAVSRSILYQPAVAPPPSGAPRLSGLSPDRGPQAGGTTLGISGSGFQAAGAGTPAVTLGGLPALSPRVFSDGFLVVTTPASASAGAVAVVVTTALGSATLLGGYTYDAALNPTAPSILSVTPSAGPLTGGAPLDLRGAGFASLGTSTVTVGGRAATGVVAVSDTQIQAVTPAGVAMGAVDVVVTNSGGTARALGAHTYTGIFVSAISPLRGFIAGGTPVTATGLGFATGISAVRVDGIAATAVTVLSDSQLTFVTPAGNPLNSNRPVDVDVRGPAGGMAAPVGFTYFTMHTVNGVTPDFGPLAGGTTVVVSGQDFLAGTPGTIGVLIDGRACTAVNARSKLQISALTPAGLSPGLKTLVVLNNNGAVVRVNLFRYAAQPTLASITPASGPLSGGGLLTVTGTGFSADNAGTNVLTIGGVNAIAVTVSSDTQLRALAPAGASAGPKNVVLTNTNGTATLAGGYRYHALPTITAVSPTSGPVAGGNTLTLTGTGFQIDSAGANTVTVGGAAATGVTVLSDTQLTLTAPAGAAGAAVALALSNANGAATLASAYTYAPPPAITSVTPDTGRRTVGRLVVVRGSGFADLSPGINTVTFGGAAATNVTVRSDGEIECKTPVVAADGKVNVSVSNDYGTGTKTDGYQFGEDGVWRPMTTVVSPRGMMWGNSAFANYNDSEHVHWTGSELLVWGDPDPQIFQDHLGEGGRYDALTDLEGNPVFLDTDLMKNP